MARGSLLRALAPMALALTLSAVALAQPTPELDAAEKAYADLDFENANKLADAFARRRGLTHEQLVRAYRLLARTHAVLDQEGPARQAFLALLTYSPDEKEDRNLPPKVTERQLEARGLLRGYSAIPGVDATAVVNVGEAGVLQVTTRDPTSMIKKVIVGYRWGSMGAYTTGVVPVGVASPFPVQPSAPGQARLEFYAQALDERDSVAFEAGNPAAPRAIQAEVPATRPPPPVATAKEGSSFLSSPVFWVVTSIVVVGAGTGLFLGLRSDRQVTLPPSQAALRPGLFCGVGRCN